MIQVKCKSDLNNAFEARVQNTKPRQDVRPGTSLGRCGHKGPKCITPEVVLHRVDSILQIGSVVELIKETGSILKGVNRMFSSDLESLKSFDHLLAKKVNPCCVGKKVGDPTPIVEDDGRGIR